MIYKEAKQLFTYLKVAMLCTMMSFMVIFVFYISGILQPLVLWAIPSNAVDFNETCYSIADGGAGLFEFNKYTGSPANIGNTGIGSPEAGTLNLVGDTFFVIDGDADEFGYVNLTTGAYTVVNNDLFNTVLSGEDGNISFDDIDAMTVDNNDVFWVASRDNSDILPSYLAKIRHDGTFIENAFGIGIDYIKYQGPDGFPHIVDAMAFDPIDELLYVCANDGSGNPTYNNLMQVNPLTGEGTLIGNFSVGDVEGLGFDGEGNMYATTGTASATTSNRNSFFAVDKTTGVATKVFSFPGQTDFETCDCIIGYKNTIKGTVFHDADENGFFGSGESGYEGATINLYYDENSNGVYDAGIDNFVRSTTTNSLGQYTLFDAYGYGTMEYVVTINPGTLPGSTTLTTDDLEYAIFSSGGNTDLYNDFGFKYDAASSNVISGSVYFDDDQDQVFDITENGVEDVTVYLYQDVNGNGSYDLGIDEIITSSVTASDGSYSFNRPFLGGSSQVSVFVNASNSDAEQSGTSMNLTSTALNLGANSVGLNFQNITIPPGATIESAHIEFVSNAAASGVTVINIYGQDVDDGTVFTGSTNNISTRTTTTAFENWVMPYWSTANVTYSSPDISSIITEIISRGGWASGNDINIIIPVTSGDRPAKSYNNNPSDAPRLVITYSDLSLADNYLTFVDISSLPTGSTLTTDNIETASFASGGNSDISNDFGIYQDLSSYNVISGTVFFDFNSSGAYDGSEVGENNISVCLFLDLNGNGTYESSIDEIVDVTQTDASGYYEFIELYEPLTANLNYTVAQSSDDIDDSWTSTDMDLALNDNGVRFQNVGIPPGAIITSAYLEFIAEENRTGTYSTLIEGVDVDNAVAFTSGQNLDLLPKTTATYTWTDVDPWSIGETKTSPEISPIIQEIIDRGGWATSNGLAIVLNSGTGRRAAYSYDGNPSLAPKLYVTYNLSDINYLVVVKENDLPTGYNLTTTNNHAITFTSGGNTDNNNDFGYDVNTTGLNVITGTVFNDMNQNQIQGVGESGVSDITIRLYHDEDCDGILDNGEPLLGVQSTNVNGGYVFYESFIESLEKRVSQSSDDADENTLSITDIDLDFAQTRVGVRFTNLAIPQGAAISQAYMQFTAEATKTGTYSYNFFGVDANNASTFSNGQNLTTQPFTSASSTWSGTDAWTVDQTYNTPSIVTMVQEIVDRPGWASGNAMAFVFNLGTGDRDAYTYDNNAGKAGKLVVDYSPDSKCYIIQLLTSSIAQGGALTTVGTQTAVFTTPDNTDDANDFGIYFAPLPVELIRFNGGWKENKVQLEWETASELNNHFFDIEWSANGTNFKSIGKVHSKSKGNSGATYTLLHHRPEQYNYYRLRQVDFDDTYSYSKVIHIFKETEERLTFRAIPNPFDDVLVFEINSLENGNGMIEIYSAIGTLMGVQNTEIQSGKYQHECTFTKSLPSGVHFAVLQFNGSKQSIKLIKK